MLSALPLVGFGNCCCCLWVLVGGALAAYLRQQNTPYQIDAAEGALVGLMAGALGGVVYSILSIPIDMLTGPMQQRWMEGFLSNNPDITPEMRDMIDRTDQTVGTARASGLLDAGGRRVLGIRCPRRPHRRGHLQEEPAAAPAPGTIDIPSSPVAPPPPPPAVEV